jgi:hypothetical protein
MNKNQKGFGLLLLLVSLAIIAAIGFIGWRVVHDHAKVRSTDSTTPVTTTSNLGIGTHSINLKTSDKILMPSGAILSLPERDAYSVPEFGYNKASESDKHLSIHDQLEVYHNGYLYKIAKGACHSAEKTFSDYTNVVVTDCTVNITTEKATVPTLNQATVSKQLTVTQRNNPQVSPLTVLSKDPFLLIAGGDGRVTYPINNGKPYLEASEGSPLSLAIVADYGVATVSYDVDELINHTEKQVSIAGSVVRVRPSSISCTPAYRQNDKCAVVNDIFIFDVNYTRQVANNPQVVIYSLK